MEQLANEFLSGKRFMKSVRSAFKKLLFIFTVFAILSPAVHAAKQYDVEIVVFSHDGSGLGGREVWQGRIEAMEQKNRKLNELRNGRRLRAVSTRSGGRLGKINDTLRASPDYSVLSHVGWRQSSVPFGSAPLIDLSTNTASGTLDGFARVYASQLLFVDIFVRYAQGGSASNINSLGGGGQFFIDEKRRLKLKETHYLDHPKFGVIVSVWPAA